MEITIIYGTETGNSESLAQDARAKLTKLGHQAKVVDMEGMTVEQLKNAGTLLVITSTWGDGEPPTNAEALHQELKDSSEDLSEVSYAVFALGDEFYENFCQAGKDFDSFLERLKAQRLLPVVLSNGDHQSSYLQKSASSGTNAWRKRFFLKKQELSFSGSGARGDNSLIFS